MAATVNVDDYLKKPTSVGLNLGGWTDLTGKLNGLYGDTINTYVNAHPEVRSAKIPYLQALANTNTELNARANNALEARVDPKTAQARYLLKTRVLEDASEGPNQQLSDLWTKMGLKDAIATGADTGSGFARSALADSTRSDYIADRDRRTGELSSFVGSNPQPEAGLDIGSIVSRASGVMDQNAANRDATKAGVVAMQQQGVANLQNSMSSVMQQIAQQREFDLQQEQGYQQAKLNAAVGNANAQNQQDATNTAAGASTQGAMWTAGGAALGALAVVGIAF